MLTFAGVLFELLIFQRSAKLRSVLWSTVAINKQPYLFVFTAKEFFLFKI